MKLFYVDNPEEAANNAAITTAFNHALTINVIESKDFEGGYILTGWDKTKPIALFLRKD